MKKIENIKFKIFTAFIFSSLMLNAQDSLIYVKKADNNKKVEIYLNNNLNSIFTEKNKVIGDVKISPNNKWIAALLVTDNARYYDSINNNLNIVSANGKVEYDLNENVREFLWSNNSKYLAIITGRFYEGGVGYIFENLIIYDLHKKQKQIVTGPFNKVGIFEFAWSPGDSSLLIKTINGFKVYEYSLTNKSLKLTKLKDINLSPDGKYYYQKRNPLIKQEFAVFDSKTNSKIYLDAKISSLDNLNYNKYGKLIGWAPNEKHSLLFKEIDENVEYEDIVVQKKTDKKPEIVIRDYKSREIKEIKYKFYDVEKNSKINEIKSTGAEHKLITSPKSLIYQEKGKDKFKEFKTK